MFSLPATIVARRNISYGFSLPILLLIVSTVLLGCRQHPDNRVRYTLEVKTSDEDMVNHTMDVLRKRLSYADVGRYDIERQGPQRIVVDARGIHDIDRLARLLTQSARLEFRLMAEPSALRIALTKLLDSFEPEVDSPDDAVSGYPLLDVFQPVGEGVVFGRVAAEDTAAVHHLLADPQVQALLPPGVELLYTAHPVSGTGDDVGFYEILGVKTQVELTGDVITDATVYPDNQEVGIQMNEEGARLWAHVTESNIGRHLAIVFDGAVFSYPVIQDRIEGGRSQITGLNSVEEARDLALLFRAKGLPTPVYLVSMTPVDE
ncbi:MAG: preprotein translocase subunit SecD [Rhodothermales bacterium]